MLKIPSILIALTASASIANGAAIYFAQSSGINGVDADGSNLTSIYSGNNVFGLEFDGSSFFYSEFNLNQVGQVNEDGSSPTVLDSAASPSGIASSADSVFYITYNSTTLYRYNKGSGTTDTLASGLLGQGVGVEYHAASNTIFFTTRSSSVFSYNLDTSVQTTIDNTGGAYQGTSIYNDRLYLVDALGSVVSMNLDGSDKQTHGSSSGAWGIDVTAGGIYLGTTSGKLLRKDLDGTNEIELYDNAGNAIWHVESTVVPEPSSILLLLASFVTVTLRRRR